MASRTPAAPVIGRPGVAAAVDPIATLPPADAPQRPRRSLARILRDTPGDWLFERNAIPSKVVAGIMVACTVVLPALHLATLGTVLAVNWITSQAPAVTQLGRLLGHTPSAWRAAYAQERHEAGEGGRIGSLARSLRTAWDPTWWTRPQMRQLRDVAAAPELPAEMRLDPNDRSLPYSSRLIIRLQQSLIRTAERPSSSRHARAVSWLAGQTDDWLAMRARTPSFVIGIGLLIVGASMGLAAAPNFVVNAAVSWIPATLGLYMWRRTGDAYRTTRPGLMQRPSVLKRYAEKHHLAVVDGGGVAAPAPPTGPGLSRRPTSVTHAVAVTARVVASRAPVVVSDAPDSHRAMAAAPPRPRAPIAEGLGL